MPFKKGQSGNPNGRRKGAVNKTTAAMKEWALDMFESEEWRKSARSRMLAGKAPHLEAHIINVLLPKTDKLEVGGEAGGPIQIIYKLRADAGNRTQ